MFNLDDDEEADLTHYGQSLGDMDDFDDAGLELSDDEESGQLNRNIVNKMHFGGFEGDKENGEDGERHKSKNEVMKEIIAKSKLYKHERQNAKQEDEAMRQDLDSELDDIRGLLSTKPSARKPLPSQNMLFAKNEHEEGQKADAGDDEKEEREYDDYDKALRDLANDKRAMATDRTKTEGEIALEEKQKLEKAERARKRRMEGLESDEEEEGFKGKRKKRKSAAPQGDDLGDDYLAELEDEVNRLGRGLTLEDIQNGVVPSSDEEDDDEEDEDEDEEGEGEDEDEDEYEEESDIEDLESGDEAPVFADEDDEDDEDDVNTIGASGSLVKKTAKKPTKNVEKREVPFTFTCPTTHAEFLKIMEGLEVEDAVLVTKRIRVLHHIKLNSANKAKIAAFFGVLVEHLGYIASTVSPLPTETLDALCIHVFEMGQQVPEAAATVFHAKLQQMHTTMAQKMTHGQASSWPDVEELTLLRSLGQVFSTSDLTHPIASPAMLFMSQALEQCRVQSEVDLGRGLFLTLLLSEYQSVSKRLLPEALNFLHRSLVMLAPKDMFLKDGVPGTFPLSDNAKLNIQDSTGGEIESIGSLDLDRLGDENVENEEGSNEMRLTLLRSTVLMIERLLQLYASTSALVELFQQTLDIVRILETVSWHSEIESVLGELSNRLERQIKFCKDKRVKTPLRMQMHRPIPIAQHLPKFEKGYSMDRHYDPDHERAQANKLAAQHKKEKKGALRELRKDNMFLAREKAKVRKQKDEDYNKMIKGVMTVLEGEQGEQNRLDRENKK
ncbi:nucleolar protein 14 [Phycomyces blakesleeanus]